MRKTTELIAPGVLDAMTHPVVANAIHFKGEWSASFDAASRQAPFYKLDGSQVQAHLMFRRKKTACASQPDYQVVALPYLGNRVSLILLMPPIGQFAAF